VGGQHKSRLFQILRLADNTLFIHLFCPLVLQDIHLFCRDFMTSQVNREVLK